MRAMVYSEYGPPPNLHLEEIEKPKPEDNQVLVKVKAVSINDWDWGLLHGKPFVNRLIYGLRSPKRQILGSDIAGVVEQVGSKVSKFKVGDEVFGDLSTSWGGFAEFVCAKDNVLIKKPQSMSFEQAAATPQAGLLALQGLFDEGHVKTGQKVLINGGGGGAGTFAIQLAKSVGAEITAIDHTNKLNFMKTLGADYVIDYTDQDFTQLPTQYDLIFDVKTNRSIYKYAHALLPNGTYITVGGDTSRLFQAMFIGKWIGITKGKNIRILFLKLNEGLDKMVTLFESGDAIPIIDKVYTLDDTSKAMRQFGESSQCGKIVITIN